MKYAVIKTGGKQYKVSEGDVIEVDRLKEEKDGNVTFDRVLLTVNEGVVQIGRPSITGVNVIGKVLDNIKGEKIRVSKYKSKVRYRRVTGFRASLSKVKIEKISESKTVKSAAKVKVIKKKS